LKQPRRFVLIATQALVLLFLQFDGHSFDDLVQQAARIGDKSAFSLGAPPLAYLGVEFLPQRGIQLSDTGFIDHDDILKLSSGAALRYRPLTRPQR